MLCAFLSYVAGLSIGQIERVTASHEGYDKKLSSTYGSAKNPVDRRQNLYQRQCSQYKAFAYNLLNKNFFYDIIQAGATQFINQRYY